MSLTDRQSRVDTDLASKYEIFEMLGDGGMGRVLRARHRQLKCLVAIKLLQHDLKAADAVTRFLREARAAAQIRSAHVAHVMDAGILDNGQPYIVMEYLQGQDLANLVAAHGRLPIEQAVDFMLQALEAIAEAHSLQIVHRDIKPGNLFATRIAGGETFIKVVDFGLAKTSHALDTIDPGVTERGAVLGTPSYMAPEQFVDAQDVDARADIWAVGATLFELLTGMPPFSGANLPQIYTAVMHKPIPSVRSLRPELPETLARVIATCLTRERALRYADVAELATALEPYAGASARGHVERIRRVVNGVRDAVDVVAPEPDVANLEIFAAPFAAPGVISSVFARGSRTTLGSYMLPRTRRYPLWLSLLVLAGAAALIWGSSSSQRTVTVDHNAAIAKPRPREVDVREQQRTDTSIAPEGHDLVPDAAIVIPPPSAAPIASAPSKPHRQKPRVPTTPKPSAASIYERYP